MSAKSNATASPDPAEAEPWLASVNLPAHRRKVRVTVRIDDDVLEWFRAAGAGCQTRVNAALRSYMEYTRGERG